MKSAGKARNNGLYRHIRTSKEIIRNLLNDYHRTISLIFAVIRENSGRKKFTCPSTRSEAMINCSIKNDNMPDGVYGYSEISK